MFKVEGLNLGAPVFTNLIGSSKRKYFRQEWRFVHELIDNYFGA